MCPAVVRADMDSPIYHCTALYTTVRYTYCMPLSCCNHIVHRTDRMLYICTAHNICWTKLSSLHHGVAHLICLLVAVFA